MPLAVVILTVLMASRPAPKEAAGDGLPSHGDYIARCCWAGARRSFWLLLAVAIVSSGSLSSALGAAPCPAAGVWFAVSAIAIVVTVALAVRIMAALTRAPGGRGGR